MDIKIGLMMRKAKYIAIHRENILAFAQVYKDRPDGNVLERLIHTYRSYIEATEDYLELDYNLWSMEKENYFISVLDDLDLLEQTLLLDIYENHRQSVSSLSQQPH
jgi:hypothetical protein|tara:strand:+ start:20498 stop:20815 length:318 start_codon:yes stop_codon:yes gene_type:complete